MAWTWTWPRPGRVEMRPTEYRLETPAVSSRGSPNPLQSKDTAIECLRALAAIEKQIVAGGCAENSGVFFVKRPVPTRTCDLARRVGDRSGLWCGRPRAKAADVQASPTNCSHPQPPTPSDDRAKLPARYRLRRPHASIVLSPQPHAHHCRSYHLVGGPRPVDGRRMSSPPVQRWVYSSETLGQWIRAETS